MTTSYVPTHLQNRARLVEDVIEQIDLQVHNQLLDDRKLDELIGMARKGYTPSPATRKAVREILACRFQKKPLTPTRIVALLTSEEA